MIDIDEGGAYVVQMLSQILSAGMQALSTWVFEEHFISKIIKFPPTVRAYLNKKCLYYFSKSPQT